MLQHWQDVCSNTVKGVFMKIVLAGLFLFLGLSAYAAPSCKVDTYLQTTEGKDKLENLIERSKGLILSKLEDLSIEEDQVQIKAIYPKNSKDLSSGLIVKINSKNLQVEGSSLTYSKVIRDEDCGIEIIISGGKLINKESGKNFGSLGRVKEFIRLN